MSRAGWGPILHNSYSIRGYAIKALVIPDNLKWFKLNGFDIEIVVVDLRDEALSPKLVADVDAVIHTANLLGPTSDMDKDTFFDINLTLSD